MKPYKLQRLLRDAIRDNPRGSEKEISDACWGIAKASPDLHHALFQYWFKNSYRDFVVAEMTPNSIAVLPVRRAVVSAAERGSAVSILVDRMEARLMDHLLSDGTALRFATFGQCTKEGGWLLAIGKQGKANEVVGKKLTEANLQNLLKRAASERRRAA